MAAKKNMASDSRKISASDVAKYFLYRALLDGDYITPLKMQKLVYLAYVKTLLRIKKKLFSEPIEAWPMGPVVRSLYQDLKAYGSSPIDEAFIDYKSKEDLEAQFPSEIKSVLDDVYEGYITRSAFELVTMLHEDEAWQKARRGLNPSEPASNKIKDEDIVSAYT